MTPELQRELRNIRFPSPPGVAVHILELAQDPDIDIGKVAKAVGVDPALTAKILRIANSPMYVQRRRSETLRQALVVLGLNATLTLALSFTLVRSLQDEAPHGLDYSHFWRRALLAAIAARALGETLRQPHCEEMFLAALLQDVGILALDQARPDLYRGNPQLQHDHRTLAEYEHKRLGADHASIGAELMKSWHLPARLYQAIAGSHTLEQRRADVPEAIFNRCVALSGPMAELFMNVPGQGDFTQIAQAAERSLGMGRQAFGQLLGRIGGLIPDTAALFDTDLGSGIDPDQILEQARDILMLRNLQPLRDLNAPRTEAQGLPAPAQQPDARHDPLTGLYNRNFLDSVLAVEFQSANRHESPLTLALADLNHAKPVKASHGASAGDPVLRAAAGILNASVRATDVVARYGEEELAILMPDTDTDTARNLAERIVQAFNDAGQNIGAGQPKTTLSIGCVTHAPQSQFRAVEDLVQAADQALYTAKLLGRNRVVAFEPQEQPRRARSS